MTHRPTPLPTTSEQCSPRTPEHTRRVSHTGCSGCLSRHLAVCSAVPADKMYVIESAVGEMRLHAGAILAHEGAPRREVYTLTRGMMRRVRLLADGRRLVAGFILPGDFIGFSSGSHYRHTIEAVTECALCAFSMQEMKTLCKQLPELESGLLEHACTELDATRSGLMTLARLNPAERLAHFLIEIGERQRLRGGSATEIALPMTRTDIADYLGLTIETVSRSFTRLRREDIIGLDGAHHVTLLDVAKLREMSGV